MKKLSINQDVAKKVWMTSGFILLLTMSLLFQWIFGPISYFNQYQIPAFPFVFGSHFFFVLSLCGFFAAYHQAGKKCLFAIFCSIVMLIAGFMLALINVRLTTLFILFSFIFSFLPLVFFIYASINIHRKYFFSILVSLVTFCLGLEVYWMKRGWSYGLHFQGIEFLHHSIFKNIFFFSLIYILMGIYYKTRNMIFLHAAILLFCVTISIVAFPWLGESI